MKRVYLDYAATTPVAPEVQKAMQPYYDRIFGNPMAMHSFGQKARRATEEAREEVADFFGFSAEEIIFTSGATESNNLALRGVIKAVRRNIASGARPERSRGVPVGKFVPHIITTAFEHHCLLDSTKYLDKELMAEVTFIKPTREGLIRPSDVIAAIKPNTVMVSVMYVNNEVGTIAPLSEIAKLVKKERNRTNNLPIYFHSDITQGVNYLPCEMGKMGVDLFSMSAHKIYGPKGVGALGVRKGILIDKIQLGGEQEFNLRAGTHNVPGIVGLGAAIEKIKSYRVTELPSYRVKKLRDYFWKELRKKVKNIRLNGSLEKRVANNLNVSFAGVEGESMLLALDMAGIACSTGSACSSETLAPSHVLLSLGLSHPQAHGSLRFTLGEGNTRADIDYTVRQVERVVEKLRKVSGYKG